MRPFLPKIASKTILGFACALLAALSNAEANLLVFKINDSHSKYTKLPALVQTISKRVKEIRKVYPETEVLITFTGDNIGVSMETLFDGGWLNIDSMVELSKHYHVTYTMGNHDPTDFVGTNHELDHGYFHNELYIKQIESLMSRVQALGPKNKGPRAVLAANAPITPSYQHLVHAYQDIPLPNKKSLRVVGLVVPELLHDCIVNKESPVQLFSCDVFKALETEAIHQYNQAAHDGIDQIIFEVHHNTQKTRKMAMLTMMLIETLQGSSAAHPKAPKILFVGAAHDHQRIEEWLTVGEMHVPFVNSRDYYATHEMFFDNDGNIINNMDRDINKWGPATVTRPLKEQLRFWDNHEQEEYIRSPEAQPFQLYKSEVALLQKVNKVVSEVLQATSTPISRIPHIPEKKEHLTLGRSRLGTLLADSLHLWTQDVVAKLGDNAPVSQGIVTFQNSTSYRYNQVLEDGDLTMGHIIDMFPFNRALGLYFLKGSEITEIYYTVREKVLEMKGYYSPQLPRHMAFNDETHALQMLVSKPGEAPVFQDLIADKYYWLATDDFIASNGIHSTEVADLLQLGTERIAHLEMPVDYSQPIHAKYFANLLSDYHTFNDNGQCQNHLKATEPPNKKVNP